jgi:hypothetical protein
VFSDLEVENNSKRMNKQDYFVIEDLRHFETLSEMFELYVDTSDVRKDNLNALWEIQLKDSLSYQLPTYEKILLFKHVATGCYLGINPSNPEEIILTYEGMKLECQFYLRSKKALYNNISYSESVRLQSVYFAS